MKRGSKKTILLSQDCIEIIQKVQQEKKLTYFTDALEFVVREYQVLETEEIADQIAEKLDERYKKAFTRIRLAANAADRNSQILLEIVNTMLLTYSDKIDMYQPIQSIESPVLQAAREEVKRKVAYYKQLKDSRERKN